MWSSMGAGWHHVCISVPLGDLFLRCGQGFDVFGRNGVCLIIGEYDSLIVASYFMDGKECVTDLRCDDGAGRECTLSGL